MAGLTGLGRLLAEPRAPRLSLDDPRMPAARRALVKAKPALRHIYDEWYGLVAEAVPPPPGEVLEIGSGPGFLGERIGGLLTSEPFLCSGMHAALDARRLPLRAGSLRAVVMTDVFHHVPDVGRFLAEAARTLRPGGTVVMIEPWVSRFSRFVYGRLHHEPFEPEAREWAFPAGGPLSTANGALPWIVFERDRALFEREHPRLSIASITPALPLRYLLSGGLSMRSFLPGFAEPLARGAEAVLLRWPRSWAMFARIVLVRS